MEYKTHRQIHDEMMLNEEYCVAYEAEENMELMRLVKEREGEKSVPVNPDDS